MPLLAGVDEAGYGPTLGPLVVGAVVFRVGVSSGRRLREILSAAVSRWGDRDGSRVVVDDSKKVFGGARRIESLEAPCGAWLAAGGDLPGTVGELLDRVAPGARGAAQGFPWYDRDEAWPVKSRREDVVARGKILREALTAAGVEWRGVAAKVCFEGEYNRRLEERNKAGVLFDLVGDVMMAVLAGGAGPAARFECDRQGGRRRYGPGLAARFAPAAVETVEERRACSAYAVRVSGRVVNVAFLLHGEEASFPVALASMWAKYLRELMMRRFNAYWESRGIRPTAGYPHDAKRWLAETGPLRREAGIDDALLIRRK
ncbi:MAG: hypothetical protein V1809_00595 [Planctomycetota bacterium]